MEQTSRNQPVRALFFDVDGTLVSFRTHRVTPALEGALHRLREKGIKLFVATGRHPVMLSYIQSVFPFDGYITLNGQYCFCGEEVVHRNPMDPAAVEELVSAARQNTFPCIFLEGRDIYINYVDDTVHQFMVDLDLPLPPVQNPRRALEAEIYQGIAFLPQEREGLLFAHAPHLNATRWHPNFLDVIPRSGGKDVGMEAMLARFQIPASQSMAFGDGENDLSMLLHAGIGVAMGSAHPEMQAQAGWTAPTVDEDGVVRALEHFGVL